MSVVFPNNAATTLSSSLAVGATSMAVTSGASFPSINASQWFYVTLISTIGGYDQFNNPLVKEIIKVSGPYTSGSTTLPNLTRGTDGTNPTAFLPGDLVQCRVNQQAILDLTALTQTTADFAASGNAVIGTMHNFTANNVILTLPAASNGDKIDFMTIGSQTGCAFAPGVGQTIEGSAGNLSINLTPAGGTLRYYAAGANWRLMNYFVG